MKIRLEHNGTAFEFDRPPMPEHRFRALCLLAGEEEAEAYAARNAGSPEPTMELDGDTEFERVIMKIPTDREHMVKLTHIFDRHLTALRAVNAKPYNTVMEQLKELAKS